MVGLHGVHSSLDVSLLALGLSVRSLLVVLISGLFTGSLHVGLAAFGLESLLDLGVEGFAAGVRHCFVW